MSVINSISFLSNSDISLNKSELLESTAQISKNGTISKNILEFKYIIIDNKTIYFLL